MKSAGDRAGHNTRHVRIEGLEELQKKLGEELYVQPEMEHALETFRDRIVNRPGKGLGARRNVLKDALSPLGLRVESTTVFPRTVGTAWGRKNTNIVKGMSGRVLTKAARRIEERWAG